MRPLATGQARFNPNRFARLAEPLGSSLRERAAALLAASAGGGAAAGAAVPAAGRGLGCVVWAREKGWNAWPALIVTPADAMAAAPKLAKLGAGLPLFARGPASGCSTAWQLTRPAIRAQSGRSPHACRVHKCVVCGS